jgi:ABC-2 type transport system permease protein
MADRPATATVLAASLRRAWLEQTAELLPPLLYFVSLGIGLLSQAFLGRMVDAAQNRSLGAYQGHYAAFLLLGVALLDLQQAAVGGLGRAIREAQRSGSLESMLVTPTPTSLLLFALTLPAVLASLARLALYAIVGALLFGLSLSTVSWPAVVAVLLASLAGFAAFALVGAALTMLLRRADPLNLFLAATSAIAGGVFYPRGVLPSWLARAGELLPITPALEALRAAMLRGELATAPLVRLLAFALVVGPIGAWLFQRSLARARVDGSLTAS